MPKIPVLPFAKQETLCVLDNIIMTDTCDEDIRKLCSLFPAVQ